MKKAIALLAACLLTASVFVGCSGKSSDSGSKAESSASSEAKDTTAAPTTQPTTKAADVTGSWVYTSFVTSDGTEYTVKDYAQSIGVDENTVLVSYTFDAAGKATCTALGMTVEGTYTFDGKTLQTAFENSSPKFDYDAAKDSLAVTDASTGLTSVMTRGTASEGATEAPDAQNGVEEGDDDMSEPAEDATENAAE